jgi:hypothetical protein
METLADLHEGMNGIVLVPPVARSSPEFELPRLQSLHTASPSQWSTCGTVSQSYKIHFERSASVTTTTSETLERSSFTLHDMLQGPRLAEEGSGGIHPDTRAMVEKPEAENVDAVNTSVVSFALSKSDRAPGTAVEGSIDHLYNSEDCSCCHGTRRGDPFWRVKWSKAGIGVGQTFNELTPP